MSAVAMLPNAPRFDTIYLRNLQLSAVIGSDAWNRPDRAQPIILSIQLQIDTTSAGISDDIKHTFSYGQLCKDITTNVDGKTFISIENLAGDVTRLAGHWPGKTLRLQVLAPKAMLRVEGGFGCDLFLRRSETEASGREAPDWGLESYEWVVRGLKLACIIGVNPHERLEKQNLSIDLHIRKEADSAQYGLQVNDGDWQRLVKRLGEAVEASSYETLEALAARIAQTALEGFLIPRITVRIEKPSALTFVEGAGVEIVRDRMWAWMMSNKSHATRQEGRTDLQENRVKPFP